MNSLGHNHILVLTNGRKSAIISKGFLTLPELSRRNSCEISLCLVMQNCWYITFPNVIIGINNEFEVIVVHPMTSRLPPRPKTRSVEGRGGSLEVMGWTTMTENELLISILLWSYCADHGITHTCNTVPFMASHTPQNKILQGDILPGQPALRMFWSDVTIECLRYCWVLGNRHARANTVSGYRGKASH